jgi:hypothetical protein
MNDYLEIARQVMRARQAARVSVPSLVAILKGQAVELCLEDGDRLFIVADEEDAQLLREPRGRSYTAEEMVHINPDRRSEADRRNAPLEDAV